MVLSFNKTYISAPKKRKHNIMIAQPPPYVRNAIRTPDGTVLVSRHVHDYKVHIDANGKEYMVDGGLEYARRNVHVDAPYEELSVESTQPFETIREAIEWGTYGKDGKDTLHYVKLSEMSDGHIASVIDHLRTAVAKLQMRLKKRAPSMELPHQFRKAAGLSSKESEPEPEPEPTEPWIIGFLLKEQEFRKEHGIVVNDPE